MKEKSKETALCTVNIGTGVRAIEALRRTYSVRWNDPCADFGQTATPCWLRPAAAAAAARFVTLVFRPFRNPRNSERCAELCAVTGPVPPRGSSTGGRFGSC